MYIAHFKLNVVFIYLIYVIVSIGGRDGVGGIPSEGGFYCLNKSLLIHILCM